MYGYNALVRFVGRLYFFWLLVQDYATSLRGGPSVHRYGEVERLRSVIRVYSDVTANPQAAEALEKLCNLARGHGTESDDVSVG